MVASSCARDTKGTESFRGFLEGSVLWIMLPMPTHFAPDFSMSFWHERTERPVVIMSSMMAIWV